MGFSSRQLKTKWAHIPDDTDVLVTHMPPLALHDLACARRYDDSGVACEVCGGIHPEFRHWGCAHLLTAVVRRVHPRLHLFGHVHERNGATFRSGTLFVNSAMDMRPKVHVIDVQVTRRDKLTQSRPRRAPDDVFASTSLSQPSRGGS